ncbi:nucleotide-diphospho-sugar transferase, partial [Rhizodiscina lignyota]
YATLVTDSSYLAGAIVLAWSLQTCGSTLPLIVLYTPSVEEDAVRCLELESKQANIILRKVYTVLPPLDDPTKEESLDERFGDTWTKLRVFELVEYDKVCYLDADMLVLKNMDTVFSYAYALTSSVSLVATQLCCCNLDPNEREPENCPYTKEQDQPALAGSNPTAADPRTHHLINSGLFVFNPSRELRDSIHSRLRNLTPSGKVAEVPDHAFFQDFLTNFFKDGFVPLRWYYNASKTLRDSHPNVWKDDLVVGFHYL